LGLDFGAVDVLLGRDGKFYVLECNTAPGVEGEGRQVIQALARKIANWVKKGYPTRKEALNEQA
jgi:glutathione synthase/RimK-type ligase-like ATP-grasp enzyme